MSNKAIIIIIVALLVLLVVIIVMRDKIKELAKVGISLITNKTWDTTSDVIISKLHPLIRKRVVDFINEAEEEGMRLRAYSGLRTFEEQRIIYGKGRTASELASKGIDTKYAKPSSKIVTNAKPGQSYHNYGLAIDVVEIKGSKALWSNDNWDKIGALAKKYGFTWGGDFKTIKDRPHVQQTFGLHHTKMLALYNAGARDGEYINIV